MDAAHAHESFEDGMRANAAELRVADANQDGQLDFDEFCSLVREREMQQYTQKQLRARFEALDVDRSGSVDAAEYVAFMLRDALMRSSKSVLCVSRILTRAPCPVRA